MSEKPRKEDRDWSEDLMVTGNELVDRIKKLVAEGNVRRLIIRKPDGDSLLEIPLTAGVAALGALAALLTEFKVEVIRSNPPAGDKEKLDHS